MNKDQRPKKSWKKIENHRALLYSNKQLTSQKKNLPNSSITQLFQTQGYPLWVGMGSTPHQPLASPAQLELFKNPKMAKKVRTFWHFARKATFGYIFANISGLSAYFSKLIFALKPWVQADGFEYHESFNRKNFSWTYKGVIEFKNRKSIGYSAPNENMKYSPCSEHQIASFFQ